MAVTTGPRMNVAMVHAWLSEYIVQWVRKALGKHIAKAKMQCVAADDELRHGLKERLKDSGFNVTKVGDHYYASGGKLTRIKLQDNRRKRARGRKRRLKWWHQLGRDAGRIVDGGVIPSIAYSMTSNGLPPAALRDARRIRGAYTRIKCKGSSLTAKLATGGPKHADVDPAVRHPAPPLLSLMNMLWDMPRTRFAYVYAWRQAVRDFVEDGKDWKDIKGPVGAAMCHLRRVGVSWDAPFRVTINCNVIDFLVTPPKQVYAYLQHAARAATDRAMIQRLAEERGWHLGLVMERYKEGVDWQMLRAMMSSAAARPMEKRALQVASSGAFWSDERRWLNGLAPDPGCAVCGEAVGDASHFYSGECAAVQVELKWRKIAGLRYDTPAMFDDQSLAPLTEMALPPQLQTWEPIGEQPVHGWLSMGSDARAYGDGSGYRQRLPHCRIATWAVVRPAVNTHNGARVTEKIRGVVPGLFPTVPRAEMFAL